MKIKLIWNKIPLTLREPIKYIVVCGTTTMIHYAFYWILRSWIPLELAFTIGYVINLIANYLWMNSFTFKTKPSYKNAIGYIVSKGLNYLFQIFILKVDLAIGLSETLAPIPAFIIAGVANFLVLRFVLNKF